VSSKKFTARLIFVNIADKYALCQIGDHYFAISKNTQMPNWSGLSAGLDLEVEIFEDLPVVKRILNVIKS
jgi:hypothetical protein